MLSPPKASTTEFYRSIYLCWDFTLFFSVLFWSGRAVCSLWAKQRAVTIWLTGRPASGRLCVTAAATQETFHTLSSSQLPRVNRPERGERREKGRVRGGEGKEGERGMEEKITWEVRETEIWRGRKTSEGREGKNTCKRLRGGGVCIFTILTAKNKTLRLWIFDIEHISSKQADFKGFTTCWKG